MAVTPSASEELLFSLWSGYNYYKPAKEKFQSVMGSYPQIVHERSEQKCYYIPIAPHRRQLPLSHWLYMISHPPLSDRFVWPIDIIGSGGGKALVFPVQDALQAPKSSVFGSHNTLEYDSQWLKRPPEHFGLENTWAKQTLLCVLRMYELLEREGYAFHDISNRSVFTLDSRMLFQFSFDTQILPLSSTFDLPEPCGCPDFADPSCRKNKQGDQSSARFSLAAIAFKLLIGTLPYKGRCVHEYGGDDSPEQHQDWLDQYFGKPVFIFDPEDSSNHLTTMNEDPFYQQRWEQLPRRLQEMFTQVFAAGNAMRLSQDRVSYRAGEWLEALPVMQGSAASV